MINYRTEHCLATPGVIKAADYDKKDHMIHNDKKGC